MPYAVSTVENIPEDKFLTSVIPVRIGKDRPRALERLAYALLDTDVPSGLGFLVVDDGSHPEMAAVLRQRCREHRFGYVRIETEFAQFSVGRCRNVGAMYATSRFILFQDVDLMPYVGFYQDALREIEIQGLEKNARDFLMFGYVFLTQQGTEDFLATPSVLRRQKFVQYVLAGNAEKIEKVSTGTSANLFNREYFLTRGGNDPDFEGWGFEDLEFNTRYLRLANLFPLPRNWTLDKYNFATIIEYEGWKAVYRLFGDLTFAKGITLFHAWHPIDAAGNYMQCQSKNKELFIAKMEEFVRSGAEPEPLPSKREGKTLLFRTNPFTFHREIRSKLGDTIVEQEDTFPTASAFLDFVRVNGVTRVLFHNPYASDAMRAYYRACRQHGVPFVVAERGALPDSLFFDPTGFLSDGTSYDARHWDRPLTSTEREAVIQYIAEQRRSEVALEDQPARLGGRGLRRRLEIESAKKVLFVALQRPSDAVTRFFCGPIRSYDRFIALLRSTATALPRDWVMVVKKHPLEDECPAIPGAIEAHDAHVKDLLDLCSAVLTLNSGTGVVAMAWERPVIYAGTAFYAHPDLNRQATTAKDVVALLRSDFRPDSEKALRFYNYLLHEFYSFGTFKARPVRLPCGSRMSATVDIDFRVIRGLGQATTVLAQREQAAIGWRSPLFDRYRAAENALRAAQRRAEAPVPVPAPAAPGAHPPAVPEPTRPAVPEPTRQPASATGRVVPMPSAKADQRSPQQSATTPSQSAVEAGPRRAAPTSPAKPRPAQKKLGVAVQQPALAAVRETTPAAAKQQSVFAPVQPGQAAGGHGAAAQPRDPTPVRPQPQPQGPAMARPQPQSQPQGPATAQQGALVSVPKPADAAEPRPEPRGSSLGAKARKLWRDPTRFFADLRVLRPTKGAA